VRARVEKVFEATASSWEPGDLYFVIRQFAPLDQASAANIAGAFSAGIKRVADYVGESELSGKLERSKVVLSRPTDLASERDLPDMMHDCLTDFLVTMREHHEIFVLKEALYSMANDYYLMAYMLWPALQFTGDMSGVLNSYIDLWRHGIRLEFFENGCISATPRELA
jgi:hypothetical protein